jgi:hypothetical protein
VENFDYLVSKALSERLQVLIDGLNRGAPTDYSEYCKLVGEIRGLRLAQETLAEARKLAGTDDE